MFEPTNIAAEIIALTALANSTLGPGLERVTTSSFRHVSVADQNEYPGPFGAASAFAGPLAPDNRIFLMTHFSLYAAVEPPVDNVFSIFYGIGYNAITVRVGYVINNTGTLTPKATALGVQGILNRPLIFVFPPNSWPVISFTPAADPRTALSMGLYANIHGYLIPASYQVIFQQFETQLKNIST